jgi:hypothetical protein
MRNGEVRVVGIVNGLIEGFGGMVVYAVVRLDRWKRSDGRKHLFSLDPRTGSEYLEADQRQGVTEEGSNTSMEFTIK